MHRERDKSTFQILQDIRETLQALVLASFF